MLLSSPIPRPSMLQEHRLPEGEWSLSKEGYHVCGAMPESLLEFLLGLGIGRRDEMWGVVSHAVWPPSALRLSHLPLVMQYGWGALMKNQFYGDRNVEVCAEGRRWGCGNQRESTSAWDGCCSVRWECTCASRGLCAPPSAAVLVEPVAGFEMLCSPMQYVGGTILGFYDLAGINMWGWLGIEVRQTYWAKARMQRMPFPMVRAARRLTHSNPWHPNHHSCASSSCLLPSRGPLCSISVTTNDDQSREAGFTAPWLRPSEYGHACCTAQAEGLG